MKISGKAIDPFLIVNTQVAIFIHCQGFFFEMSIGTNWDFLKLRGGNDM